MIKINNLNKFFFKGRSNEIHVINDISIELPEKGIVTFFGKSGCGKTTLLNTIGGLDSFKSGDIEIDGKNIKKNTDYIRNKYIGYIFQNYNLNLKVSNYENVAEALRLCGMNDEEVIKERVEAALTNVGLEKYIYRMPDTLSGGQKQRVAIARAIVKNPRIILADEPTGNLDEANTIMIMDLLKSISKDHLVLLVTHEANLVDYYCDKVVELADGQIKNVYDNDNANGYVAKDKNIIYLGEYEKKEVSVGGATLVCYGEDMPEDIQIQLVNQDGKLCVKINSPRVKVVDESSEIEFREGVFEAENTENRKSVNLDMSRLPEFEGNRYGRLFTLKNAIKESWASISGNKKKSSKALKNALIFFSFIITMMFGAYGTMLKDLMDIKASVNYNTFAVYVSDTDKAQTLYNAASKGEYGIDYVRPHSGSLNVELENKTDIFESFNYQSQATYFSFVKPIKSHGVILPENLAADKKLVAGRADNLNDKEIVLSSNSADYLLENVKYSFIKNYEDLIGLPIDNYRIVGVVEADEPAFYVNTFVLIDGNTLDYISYDPLSEISLASGEAVAVYNKNSSATVKVGDVVEVEGLTLKVVQVDVIAPTFTENDMRWILEQGLPNRIDTENGEYYAVYGDEYGAWSMSLTEQEYEAYLYYVKNGATITDEVVYEVCKEDYIQAAQLKNAKAQKTYMLVHTTDAKSTEKFLHENFDNQTLPEGIVNAVISAESIIKSDVDKAKSEMFDDFTILAGFLAVLCLCVYMIMRSSVMARIKEIGIYRCIGVTKKNLVFRYFVEAFMLTSVSVLPGFLIVVGFEKYMKYVVGMSVSLFFPWWICLGLIALLYLVCVVCGILPTIALMHKTPSQIIAKYDV